MTSFQNTARTLLANDYLIVPIKARDKRPAMSRWQDARIAAGDVPRLWSNGAGVGVLCGVGAQPICAVDIDIRDHAAALELERWCEQHLGGTAVRIGEAPKRLLVYRAAEPGWRKLSTKVWIDEVLGTENKVEVLGLGQQFVAYGIHPGTGREFDWIDGLDGLAGLTARDLPVADHEALEELLRVAEGIAARLGWVVKGAAAASVTHHGGEDRDTGDKTNHGGLSQGENTADAGGVVAEGRSLRSSPSAGVLHTHAVENSTGETLIGQGPSRSSFEAHRPAMGLPLYVAEDAIAALPAEDYETWVRVGMALHHEFDSHRAAYEAWDAWSRSSSKYPGQQGPSGTSAKWSSFGRDPGRVPVTLAALLGQAGIAVREVPPPPGQEGTDGASTWQVGPRAEMAEHPRRAKTEMGNAERLLDHYGKGLMYAPEIKRWFRWTGTTWVRALDVEIEHLAKSTILALRDEVDQWPEGDERESFFKFCANSQKANMVGNMIRLATSDPRVVVPASELDRHPRYLGARNGVVDLHTGDLLPPDPDRRITLCCGCEYDPEARSELWESTVSDVFDDDPANTEFFQRLVGYALLGQPNQDVLVIPWGTGSNGKSTIMGVLTRVFGDYAHSAAAESFVAQAGRGGTGGVSQVGPRPDLLAMRGTRLVWVGEPEEGAELRESFVKTVSGGDPIPARAMHSNDIIQIQPSWVVWMPTNHKPIVRGDDWAIWRRLLLVPFTRNFDHDPLIVKDPEREDKLLGDPAHLQGVLRWAVEGALAFRRSGLRPPDGVQGARDRYREDMDLLAEWLGECCETGDPDLVDSAAQLWQSWEAFARNRGELRMVPSQRALSRRLESRGFAKVRHAGARGVRGFKGVKVRNLAEWD